MRKLDNISIRQTYRWKARFVCFMGMYSVSTSTSGLWEISQKSNDYSTKTQMQAANCCCPWCDNSRCRRPRAACIFMNARYGAVLHCPRPGQPVATRPIPKLFWTDLSLLTRDVFVEGIVALLPWCSSVCSSVRRSVCMRRGALWSYGALKCGFKFTVG